MAGFSLFPYRFTFDALEPLSFASGAAGNAFRGAFGLIFRRVAGESFYARFFEPRGASGPSGLANAPRPFVIRAASLENRRFETGEPLGIDVHVFDLEEQALPSFVRAFAELAREGIGGGRARVLLRSVHTLDAGREPDLCVYRDGRFRQPLPGPLALSLAPDPEPVARAAVRFLTPMELKSAGGIAQEPAFGVLFARIRDRVGALRQLYGKGALEIDFRGMAARAALVRMTEGRFEWVSHRRRSSRTGQTHPLGGFIGEACYEGDLAEFMPYLRAAYWTGAGRQTVWGKGALGLASEKTGTNDVKGPL